MRIEHTIAEAINADRLALMLLRGIGDCCGTAQPQCDGCREMGRRAAASVARAEAIRDELCARRLAGLDDCDHECAECGDRPTGWDHVAGAWLCDRCGEFLDAERGQE